MEVTSGALAAMLGKSSQWIRQLTRDGVLKKTASGKYRLDETLQTYISYVLNENPDEKGPKKSDYDREIAEIKRDKARIELEELRGNVHFAEDVQRVVGHMIVEAKTKMLAIAPRVAMQAAHEPAPVVKKLIEAEIFAALEALSTYDPAIFHSEAGDSDDSEEDADAL